MIEGRPLPQLVPQLLHMLTVVPPDWRFMFIGTNQSVISVSRSFATQYHEANGKLDLVVLPEPFSIESKEHVYRLLTDLNFYDQYMQGVEWMMKFESDAIMCANSNDSLNDWLDYDWAGAPRYISPLGCARIPPISNTNQNCRRQIRRQRRSLTSSDLECPSYSRVPSPLQQYRARRRMVRPTYHRSPRCQSSDSQGRKVLLGGRQVA